MATLVRLQSTGPSRWSAIVLSSAAVVTIALPTGCSSPVRRPVYPRSAYLSQPRLAQVEPARPVPEVPAEPVAVPRARALATVPLLLAVRAGRTKLPPDQPYDLPVAIDVRADQAQLERPPLDVSLVFDRSRSMEEERKIAYTLEAARLLVANLSPQDTLSIVTFGTEATVLERQQPATRRLFLAHWFDELEPDGYTNLSGGLLAGLAELRRVRRPEARAKVILLTDGLANQGITDRPSLLAIAERAGKSGITISTIGVGEDYGRGLVEALAQASGGRHQHVPRGEGIPAAVAREIGGLVPLAAQNVELELVPGQDAELVDLESPDGRPTTDARRPGEPVVTALGDLAPGDRRCLFAILRVPPGAPGDARPVLVARLRFQDPAGESSTDERRLWLDVASSPADSDETTDEALLSEVRLVRLLDLARRAVVSRDEKLATVAGQRIGDETPILEATARSGATEAQREQAALVLHLGDELAELRTRESLHPHEEEEVQATHDGKEALFQRYLLLHHRPQDWPGRD